MQIVVVHLSDIHIRTSSDRILGASRHIALAAVSEARDADAFFIAVTGDIAFSGQSQEYLLARGFLDEMRKAISDNCSAPIHVVLCPGNHDCDFSGSQEVRDIVIAKVRGDEGANISDDLIRQCVAVQKNYEDFRATVEGTDSYEADLLLRSHRFDLNGLLVGFDSYNFAWMSSLKETKGSIVYPCNRVVDITRESLDINFALIHHPFGWLSTSSARQCKRLIRERSSLILSGHEHEPAAGNHVDRETGQTNYIEGGVLQEKGSVSGFNLVRIDTVRSLVSVRNFSARSDGRYHSKDDETWTSLMPHLSGGHKGTKFKSDFLKRIGDPGASFHHPGRQNLELWDIYVYPDLRYSADDDNSDYLVKSARNLTLLENLRGGTVLKGGDKTGKSALLYSLFESYAEQGMYPLLIDGEKITVNNRRLEELEQQAIGQQYADDFSIKFSQSEKKDRILLLDNLDRNNITIAQRNELVESISKQYDYFCITTSELLDLDEMIDTSTALAIAKLPAADILEFGYQRQLELIERWLSLSDSMPNKTILVRAVDHNQKMIDQFFGRGLVPRVPILLLTVVQGVDNLNIDANRASLAECYRTLINGALIRNGVQEEIREYIRFLSCLSWLLCGTGRTVVSLRELETLNAWFAKEVAAGSLEKRLEILKSCKLVEERDGGIAFKYQYIYYYFVGEFLSRNTQEPIMRSYISSLCERLYIRHNAHVILFLAYHCRDNTVLSNVSAVLERLFNEHSPFDFSSANTSIGNLLDEAPKLVYRVSDAVDNRRKQAEIRDASEGEQAIDEYDGGDDLLSKLILLIKTSEIIGLILKAQYADLSRSEKEGTIKRVFDGTLRAINDFADFVKGDQDGLIELFKKALEDRTHLDEAERGVLARRVTFYYVSYIIWSMLHRASLSVGAEKIQRNLQNVVASTGSDTYKLFEIFSQLESGAAMPIHEIRDLCARNKDNNYLLHVLKLGVLHRLYMFKNKREEVQRACDLLEISIKTQRAIQYKTQSSS